MDNNKEFSKFTSKTLESNYNYNNQDELTFADNEYSFEYLQKANAIEICLNKLGYSDQTKIIKEHNLAANCIIKLRGSYQYFLFDKVSE